MSKLLWAFEIGPGRDESGKTIKPDLDPVTGYCEGFLVCANPYKAEFKVRGKEREETILREYAAAERDVFGKYKATGEEKA